MPWSSHIEFLDGVAGVAVRVVADPHDEVQLQDEQYEAGVAASAVVLDGDTYNGCSNLQTCQTASG